MKLKYSIGETSFEFDGTAEELLVTSRLLPSSDVLRTVGEVVVADVAKIPTVDPVTACIAVFTRKSMSDAQIQIIDALTAEGPTEYQALKKMTGITALGAVLGTLGRRVANTPEIAKAGLPQNSLAIIQWEERDGKYYYFLTPYALEALKQCRQSIQIE
jgi:hypothetical protein